MRRATEQLRGGSASSTVQTARDFESCNMQAVTLSHLTEAVCITANRAVQLPTWVDAVEKRFCRHLRARSIQDQSRIRNIDSRAQPILVRISILQFLRGDFFDSIGQTRSFDDVGSMSDLSECGRG